MSRQTQETQQTQGTQETHDASLPFRGAADVISANPKNAVSRKDAKDTKRRQFGSVAMWQLGTARNRLRLSRPIAQLPDCQVADCPGAQLPRFRPLALRVPKVGVG